MTTEHVVADDLFGQIARRQWELERRVLEGTLDPEFVLTELQRIIEGQKTQDVFTVTVNYDMSLADMVAVGKYDWMNSDITPERFPVQGEGKVERKLVLVHFGRTMTTEQVLEELSKRGLRSAKIEDLLALGTTHPDLQRQFPIVAPGSVWQYPYGGRFMPYLGGSASGRLLHLLWDERDWDGADRFLALCK